MLDQLIDIIRFMTAGCLLLIILKLIRSESSSHQKVPASGFSICVLGYLMIDWEPLREYGALYFFLVLAVALPFVFWLFSQSLFNDPFRLKRWMLLALVGFVSIQVSFFLLLHKGLGGISEDQIRALSTFQFTLPLLFVILGIMSAVQGRQVDLITLRFQFRTHFIWLTASLILLTLFSEIAFQGSHAPLYLDLGQKVLIAGLTFFFASHWFMIKPGFFLIPAQPTPQAVAKPVIDDAIIAKLTELMDRQQHWRTEGLTIRQLAETLQVKEYKLRSTINQHLSFRNFNDYLHSYRIGEACKLLADQEKKDLTILEIAYEMGYNSLAPFNKAFKQTTGMTPSAWRRSKMV